MANCCVNPAGRFELLLLERDDLPANGQPVTRPTAEWGSHEHGAHL